jgi:hypothetical protein
LKYVIYLDELLNSHLLPPAMSGYPTVGYWLFESDEVLDHALPAEVLEFFRTDEAASVPCKIYVDFTCFYEQTLVTTRIEGVRRYMNSVDVRGFSSEERASVDVNTVMTSELRYALCASASRARSLRL